jgi:uncharacterized BrkB/YihY/UPF0761 family membrane protein
MVMNMRKGQFTVVGLVAIFVAILTLGALFPTITEFIEQAKLCATSSVDLVLDAIPLLLVVAILMSILIYATASRQPQY